MNHDYLHICSTIAIKHIYVAIPLAKNWPFRAHYLHRNRKGKIGKLGPRRIGRGSISGNPHETVVFASMPQHNKLTVNHLCKRNSPSGI